MSSLGIKKLLFLLARVTEVFKLKGLWSPIYQLFYFRIKAGFTIHSDNIQLWVRNSFLDKTFSPPVSDIDITIFSHEFPPSKDLMETAKRQVLLNPLLHEINTIYLPNFDNFCELANSYELNRDPKLRKAMNYFNERNDNIEKNLFLLKTLKSDCFNLENHHSIRQRKWSKLFSLLELEKLTCFNLKTIVEYLSLRLNINSLELTECILEQNIDSKLAYLFPVEFLIQEFKKEGEPEFPRSLGMVEKDYLRRALENELWGIYIQLLFISSSSIDNHLGNLDRYILRNLESSEEIQIKLNDLKRLNREFQR